MQVQDYEHIFKKTACEMCFVVRNQLAEVPVVFRVGRGREALWVTSATVCPVDLSHVAVLVLVSGLAELRCLNVVCVHQWSFAN